MRLAGVLERDMDLLTDDELEPNVKGPSTRFCSDARAGRRRWIQLTKQGGQGYGRVSISP